MKILTVSYSDIGGGAAMAAYRVHRGLVDAGYDAVMLVQVKETDDHTVIGPTTKLGKFQGILRPELDKLLVKKYKNKTQTLFSPGLLPFSRFVKKIEEINPDIIHLHWVANSFFPIKDFRKFKTPIVWTMHDMWAFTGGCHYDEACGKYKKSCGSCPVLGSKREKDLSKRLQRKKIKSFSKIDKLIINGPSKWIADAAKESAIFQNRKVVNLPNLINVDSFRAIEKGTSRQLLRLPYQNKLIAFGAMNAASDPRKGFKELHEALNILKIYNTELIVFGSSKPKNPIKFNYPVHYLGKLKDEISLRLVYSAADVVVVPSLQENLSNVIVESLACGSPVVAFDIGGNSDMITHLHNGYLAQPFDSEDLATGIKWALTHILSNQLSINARQKAVSTYNEKVVIPQYVELYEQTLKK